MSELSKDILRTRRPYFIDKVKKPLMKAIIILGNRYPEPTKENTEKHISHVVLDVWDEFFQFQAKKGRVPLFHAIRRIVVGELEHDTYYTERMVWFLLRLFIKYLSGEWEPCLPADGPTTHWLDPDAIEKLALARMEYIAEGTVHGVKVRF